LLVEAFVRHLVSHGIVAFFVAIVALIVLRGFSPGLVVICGLPPVFAGLCINARVSRATRFVAWAFLGTIALGTFIACCPGLFPNLGGLALQPAPWQERTLVWYIGVYFVWVFDVLPIYVFCSSLRAHRAGRHAHFSRPTCYLGLATSALTWIGMPSLLLGLGFWPVI
jgi:hypothetical protein